MKIRLLKRRPGQYVIWLLTMLLVIAMLIWVLNSEQIIGGSWAIVINVIFSSIGVILALLQWYTQAFPSNPLSADSFLPEKCVPPVHATQGITRKRKGAVSVYARSKWRGTTLYLYQGIQETSENLEGVAIVVEQRGGGKRLVSAHFPVVPPGHYTLVAPAKKRWTHVTVWPGQLSEVDWC